MSFRTTLLLLFACIVVTIAAEYTERHNRPWFNRDVDQPFNFPLSSLAEIEFENSQGAFRCEQYEQDAWRLTAPIQFPAAFPALERMALALRELRIRDKLDVDQPGFGLDQAQTRVRFQVGAKRHELRFGAAHPTEAYVYASHRVNDNPAQVILVDTQLVDVFGRVGLQELRDDALCDVNWRRLQRLAIYKGGDMHVDLELRDNLWRLIQPFASPADPGIVHHVTNTMNSWGIESFVADGVDPFASGSPYGLDQPRWEIHVGAMGSAATREIVIGGDGPADERGRGMVYVAWRGDDHVFLGSDEILELLATRPDQYRDRFLFRLPDPELKGLKLGFRDAAGVRQDLLVERDGDSITMRANDDARRYPVAEEWWLVLTRDLRTAWLDTFLERDHGDLDLSQYGLDKPLRIELTSDDGTVDVLFVGDRVAEGDPRRYVINPRWKDYFGTAVLPREEDLRGIPWTFRSTTVLDLDPSAVIEFGMRDNEGRALEFVRPYQKWRIKGGAGREVTDGMLYLIVREAAGLRAVAWEPKAESPPGPDAYDLRIDVTSVRDRDDFEPVTFYIGPPLPGNQRLIREEPSGWVFRWRLLEDGRNPSFLYAKQVLLELTED
ncbi:MAG: DUF4340 domain-containing protein [Planctomycetota bacterium]